LELAARQIVSRAISSDKVIDIFDAAGLKKPDITVRDLCKTRTVGNRNAEHRLGTMEN
jgi:type I restriction enzyme R subunit